MWIDECVGNRPGGAGDRVGEQAQCGTAHGTRARPTGAQQMHGNPGHDEQLRPGQRSAQPVRVRLDPGRLEQRDAQLVGDQQGTHQERARQQVIVENALEQGAARWEGVLHGGVGHTSTLPSLPAAARRCLTCASPVAQRSRTSAPRQQDSRGVPDGRPLRYVPVPRWEPLDHRGVPSVQGPAAGDPLWVSRCHTRSQHRVTDGRVGATSAGLE